MKNKPKAGMRSAKGNPTERATIVNRAAKYQPTLAKQARQRDRQRKGK